MVSMTHFVDIAVGSSATGEEDYGLTEYGKDYVRRLLELGFMIDLSHTGIKTIDDLIQVYDEHVKNTGQRRLLVVSHSKDSWPCGHRQS